MKPDVDPLRGGACTNLPPVAIDKYFFANNVEDPFSFRTAQVICCRCAVKAACVEDAITSPTPDSGVRAGQCRGTLQDLHTEYLAGVPISDLVDRVMAQDQRKRTRYMRISHKPGLDGNARCNFMKLELTEPAGAEEDGE